MRVSIVLVLLLSTSSLLAEEAPPPAEIPAPAEIPPPIVAPPPLVAPLGSPALDRLERNGRQNRVAGSWLMGAGAVLSVMGGLLTAYAFAPAHQTCYSYGYYGACSNNINQGGLMGALVTGFIGGGLLSAGMPIYFVGRAQEKQAGRERAKSRVAWAPGGFRF